LPRDAKEPIRALQGILISWDVGIALGIRLIFDCSREILLKFCGRAGRLVPARLNLDAWFVLANVIDGLIAVLARAIAGRPLSLRCCLSRSSHGSPEI